MKHHPRQWATSILLMFASLTCLRPASLAMFVEWTEIHFDIYIIIFSHRLSAFLHDQDDIDNQDRAR